MYWVSGLILLRSVPASKNKSTNHERRIGQSEIRIEMWIQNQSPLSLPKWLPEIWKSLNKSDIKISDRIWNKNTIQ